MVLCLFRWPLLKSLSGSWDVLMRCFASALFLLAHGLLVLEHVAVGTALHGVAELFDLWGTVRLTAVLG